MRGEGAGKGAPYPFPLSLPPCAICSADRGRAAARARPPTNHLARRPARTRTTATPTERPVATERIERLERSGSSQSFGHWLRAQREHREVSLREIADATKISLRYLQALEDDRFDVLPALVFARGFLREYAKFVGLDADEVVTFFASASGAEQEEDEVPRERVSQRVASSSWTTVLLLLGAVAVLLALVAAFWYWAERRDESSADPPVVLPVAGLEISPPAPEPAVTAAQHAAPEPLAPLRLQLDFVERCWVDLRSDGVSRASENYAAGDSLSLEAEEEVLLTLGNPQGVRLTVNEQAVALPVQPGRVLHDFRVDLALVTRLAAAPPTADGAPSR